MDPCLEAFVHVSCFLPLLLLSTEVIEIEIEIEIEIDYSAHIIYGSCSLWRCRKKKYSHHTRRIASHRFLQLTDPSHLSSAQEQSIP